MPKRTINDLVIGQSDCFAKTITETDVSLFAGISGDLNPVHVNAVAASESIFKSRVAHGALVASLFSTVLGTKLPGEGTIYLKQESSFMKPVYLGDTITATCTITEIIKEKGRVTLSTVATNQKGEVVITGEAIVKVAK
jgi:3-hydroxybutyryl-CoA dehydratase